MEHMADVGEYAWSLRKTPNDFVVNCSKFRRPASDKVHPAANNHKAMSQIFIYIVNI